MCRVYLWTIFFLPLVRSCANILVVIDVVCGINHAHSVAPVLIVMQCASPSSQFTWDEMDACMVKSYQGSCVSEHERCTVWFLSEWHWFTCFIGIPPTRGSWPPSDFASHPFFSAQTSHPGPVLGPRYLEVWSHSMSGLTVSPCLRPIGAHPHGSGQSSEFGHLHWSGEHFNRHEGSTLKLCPNENENRSEKEHNFGLMDVY